MFHRLSLSAIDNTKTIYNVSDIRLHIKINIFNRKNINYNYYTLFKF